MTEKNEELLVDEMPTLAVLVEPERTAPKPRWETVPPGGASDAVLLD